MTQMSMQKGQYARFRERTVQLSLFFFALLLGLLNVSPLLWMVSAAFKGTDDLYSLNLVPNHPTLDNFVYVLTEANFPRWILNSFFVSTVISLAGLWFHSMAGYALARLRFPGRAILFFLLFSTYLVSFPVIIVPLFILVKVLGWINSYTGLIVPAIFNVFGIFLLRQFYLGIPKEMEEAAVIDGAGYWRLYWEIVLPLSRPILATLFVFFFLANWNAFLWPLTITRDPELYVVQVGIMSFRQQYSSAQNYVMAGSVIVALPTVLLFLIFQRQLIESIKTSGLTG
jgi:multiple sugar transport system permease protein